MPTHLRRTSQVPLVPDRNATGVVAGAPFLGHAHDVLQSVIDAIADPIFIKDRRQRCVLMNDACSVMLGQPSEALPKRADGDMPVQSPTDVFELKDDRLFELIGCHVTEDAWMCEGGTLRHVQTQKTSFMSANGEVLVVCVIRDTAERQRLVNALQASEHALSQSRDLIAYQAQVRDDERKQIGIEMLEDVGQNLMAVHMSLSLLGMLLEPDTLDTPPHQWAQLEHSRELLHQSIEMVRTAASTLHPSVLDLGVQPAIEWLARTFTNRTAIACELRVGTEQVAMSEGCVLALFRITETLLDNVSQYAEASRVAIALERREDDCFLCMRDNGKAWSLRNRHRCQSRSLLAVQERARALGGNVSTFSAPDGDSVIEVRVPVHACTHVGISL